MDYGIYEVASLQFLLANDPDTLVGSTDKEFDGQLLLPFPDADQSHRR